MEIEGIKIVKINYILIYQHPKGVIVMKKCSKCKESYPKTTEYFYKSKLNSDGLNGQCKKCYKERVNSYNKRNKKKRMRYLKENKNHIAVQRREYRKRNSENIKDYNKTYRENNPDIVRLADQRRYAKKKLLPSTLTLEQWMRIKESFDNKCAYCGMSEEQHKEIYNEQLHQEHFIPISHKGGHEYGNIIPSCRSCNCSKQDEMFLEWYPHYEHYNKCRESYILEYIKQANE